MSEIIRNSEYKKAKEKFDQLEKVIDNFYEKHLDRPQLFIHEFFAEIRNKIDIQREIFISRNLELNLESIHKRSEEFMSRLKQLEQECYQNEIKIEKMNLREDKKDELKSFSEYLRLENINDNELIEMKEKINNTIEEAKMKSKTFENVLLMNKTISFVEEESEQLGHLIINQRFDQFEITEESGKLMKTFKGHTDQVYCIKQIEDFSKILTCSDDFTIKIWSTESGECLKTLTGHTRSVTSLIISNDKEYLISGSYDETVKVWNIQNDFECVQTLEQEESVRSLCLLPNNILVCGLVNGTIIKFNLNDFTKLDSFRAHESAINDIKHVSSSKIVSCSWEDKNIKLWNLESNECLRTFFGHLGGVDCLEISFDKSKLYSGSRDRTFRIWDISSGECLKTIKLGSFILCLKLLSSNFIAAGSIGFIETEENLKIIDLNSHEIVKFLVSRDSVYSLIFDSEKNVLFSGSHTQMVQMCQF
jgi:WD40 repeat protein